MTSVSIIVPCYNEQETITLLMDAVYKQSYPRKEMELVISDGLSTDATRDKIRAFQGSHPDLKVLLVENKNRIIPSGLNRAIEASTGSIIIRLDAHSMPSQDYVERSVADLEAGLGDNIGGVWDIRPGGKGWIAESIAAAASLPVAVGNAHYRYTSTAGKVDTVPFGAFRKEMLEKIGKYDETLLTNEDYELNTRLVKAGGQIWLDPAIRSVYFARPTLSGLARQYYRYGFWKWRMLTKYLSTIRLRQALPPLFILSLIVLILASPLFFLARILLLIECSVYLVILLASAIPEGARRKDWRLCMGIPLAIITMHLCWGTGFWVSVVKSSGSPAGKGKKSK
jgi:succinoglycan biosynthesis protein ExoA